MGPERSLEKLRKSIGKPSVYRRTLEVYSSNYNWVERATSYDDYIKEKQRKKYEVQLDRITGIITDTAEEVLIKTKAEMMNDRPGAYAATERFTAAVNAVIKTHGLDKKQLELSGEVKTSDPERVTRLKEALVSTLTPEARAELSARLMKLVEEDD